MHGDAIWREKLRCGTYFIENEKKKGNLSSLCNGKVMSAFYWLWKEEEAHSKLNSLLQLLESLWKEKVATFKKRSIRVLLGQSRRRELNKTNQKTSIFWYSYRRSN